jgi:hypothetical protein
VRSSASRRDRIALAVPSITHRAKHPYKERKDEILSTLRRMVTDHSLMEGKERPSREMRRVISINLNLRGLRMRG